MVVECRAELLYTAYVGSEIFELKAHDFGRSNGSNSVPDWYFENVLTFVSHSDNEFHLEKQTGDKGRRG